MREQRKKIWIDRFQTALSIRIAVYLVLYQVAIWTIVVMERNTHDTLVDLLGSMGAIYGHLMLTGSLAVIGMFYVYDALIYAHRLVGPIHRFRKTVNAITAGDEVELVRLRQGDYLHEFKDEFNEMLKYLEQRGVIQIKADVTQEKVAV